MATARQEKKNSRAGSEIESQEAAQAVQELQQWAPASRSPEQQSSCDNTDRAALTAGAQQHALLLTPRGFPSPTSHQQADSNGWDGSSTAINSAGILTLCLTVSIIASLLRSGLIPLRLSLLSTSHVR